MIPGIPCPERQAAHGTRRRGRLTTFTDRGIECMQELLADIRTWTGGILGFLRAEKCDPDFIERIMADEKNR